MNHLALPSPGPALPGPSLLDRLLADQVTRAFLAGGFCYSGYDAGWRDGNWLWFVLWCLAGLVSNEATMRIARMAPYFPDRPLKPPWPVRFLGHPILAWPIVGAGCVAFALFGHEAYLQGALLEPAQLVVLWGLYAPVAWFGRWASRRDDWIRVTRAAAPPDIPAPRRSPRKPEPRSLVRIAVTPQSTGPTIVEAVERLPPELRRLILISIARHTASPPSSPEAR